jgi:hypothetical protein
MQGVCCAFAVARVRSCSIQDTRNPTHKHTDSIEAGDQKAPTIGARFVAPTDVPWKPGKKSPYGLWGALGSRGAKETIEEQLNQ